jgi:hypothetical protein
MVMRLVPDSISSDTVGALTEMLEQARSGELKSLVFIATYRRQEFIANWAGDIRRNPTLARGMIATLDDWIASQPAAK